MRSIARYCTLLRAIFTRCGPASDTRRAAQSPCARLAAVRPPFAVRGCRCRCASVPRTAPRLERHGAACLPCMPCAMRGASRASGRPRSRTPLERCGPQRERERGHRERGARPRQFRERHARVDRGAAEPRAERVAEIERALVERRREIRRVARAIDDQDLQRRHDREREHAPHENRHERGQRCAHRARERGEHDADRRERRDERRYPPPVGELAADGAADRQPEAEQQQHERDVVRREARHVLEDRRDVREHGEEARRREHADAEHHQHLRVAQHAELARDAGRGHLEALRHAEGERRRGERADAGDGPERRAPAERLAERGAERHAEHVREREAGEHQRDRLRALVRRDEVARDHRADAEERAVAERGDDARDHQRRVAGRDRAKQITDDEHADQREQRRLARHFRGDDGEDRRADRHAERIAGHEHARRRNRHAQIARDIRQEPHDDELGGTDAKRGNGKGKQRQWHGRLAGGPPRPAPRDAARRWKRAEQGRFYLRENP
ncbi:hypothetical protein BURPS1710b_3224 [Burkholderia pseudomallei 1710b]|uniref:Uncharacterized protein n=1 Tax=Burkholderia pseudomallei (strain 1710b) TaxID=320372 RepID=Q3JPA8_BURP1|nr:hypothetical protein BURPS1710b_3224 [Burkholderia pseudomallei 1710b]